MLSTCRNRRLPIAVHIELFLEQPASAHRFRPIAPMNTLFKPPCLNDEQKRGMLSADLGIRLEQPFEPHVSAPRIGHYPLLYCNEPRLHRSSTQQAALRNVAGSYV